MLMKSILLPAVLCSIFVFVSCTHTYTNQPEYHVEVGEQFEIYYTTNSCCRYCLLNENQLQFLSVIEDERVIEDYPNNCAGCSRTSAFVLEATKPGVDTIFIRKTEMSSSCSDSSNQTIEQFIVWVDG